jgi:hypothetical protein
LHLYVIHLEIKRTNNCTFFEIFGCFFIKNKDNYYNSQEEEEEEEE